MKQADDIDYSRDDREGYDPVRCQVALALDTARAEGVREGVERAAKVALETPRPSAENPLLIDAGDDFKYAVQREACAHKIRSLLGGAP